MGETKSSQSKFVNLTGTMKEAIHESIRKRSIKETQNHSPDQAAATIEQEKVLLTATEQKQTFGSPKSFAALNAYYSNALFSRIKIQRASL